MFNRREFIKGLSLASMGWVSLGNPVLAEIQREVSLQNLPTLFRPIRIRGRVTTSGQGLYRVAVSDGRSVVWTNSSGEYTLYSSSDRDFFFYLFLQAMRFPDKLTVPPLFSRKSIRHRRSSKSALN
ncbi:hypothetical protein Aoki45_02420 [Algoriphagus sp. oki45]|uniref:metallophosphoesterase N-terminal domain-containing protein n=1 Tax=Algoriphagus sp. oki45 TaxID=3067294 RepID=UPI0027FBB82D|nr:hypothetical protein Aoki45_02420 [Algoriphagus sp. oki45]